MMRLGVSLQTWFSFSFVRTRCARQIRSDSAFPALVLSQIFVCFVAATTRTNVPVIVVLLHIDKVIIVFHNMFLDAIALELFDNVFLFDYVFLGLNGIFDHIVGCWLHHTWKIKIYHKLRVQINEICEFTSHILMEKKWFSIDNLILKLLSSRSAHF